MAEPANKELKPDVELKHAARDDLPKAPGTMGLCMKNQLPPELRRVKLCQYDDTVQEYFAFSFFLNTDPNKTTSNWLTPTGVTGAAWAREANLLFACDDHSMALFQCTMKYDIREGGAQLMMTTARSYVCLNCGTKLQNPSFCEGCKWAAYCSRDCQIDHWTHGEHKSMCPLITRAIVDSTVTAAQGSDVVGQLLPPSKETK